jgi:hypothetical protein
MEGQVNGSVVNIAIRAGVLLVQQGMVKALYGTKPEEMADIDWKELEVKAVATIRLCLGDDVMYHVMDKGRISGSSLVETGKSVYVKVVDEQTLSKAVVVRLENGGGLIFEPTHQHVQSYNQRFEEG